jgi:DNA-binding response OmpR family regulator
MVRVAHRPTTSHSGHEAGEDALRPKLLIVEDDGAMREVWRVVFETRGWEVAVATTAAEGRASLDPPPDHLLLDLLLPDQGGEAILRKIRDGNLKTRVAVTTAANDPLLLSEVRAMQPEAVFKKPVEVADVWQGVVDDPVGGA